MPDQILSHEPAIRLTVFLGIVTLMVVWEFLAPRRRRRLSRGRRWPHNIALVVVNTLMLRLLFPAGAISVALFARQQGLGLFNLLDIPPALATVAAVALLDMAIYFQHIAFHIIPWCWRLHQVHHADVDFDVTTGSRFHPLEIALSMLIKFSVILMIGAPALAVLIFELLLNGCSMFNHGNVNLPRGLDRWVRRVLVTPDMHRVHHSVLPRETNSNYGFSVSWWDRLFGTYVPQPRDGHQDMTIGLEVYQDPATGRRLDRMLLMPFRTPDRGYEPR